MRGCDGAMGDGRCDGSTAAGVRGPESCIEIVFCFSPAVSLKRPRRSSRSRCRTFRTPPSRCRSRSAIAISRCRPHSSERISLASWRLRLATWGSCSSRPSTTMPRSLPPKRAAACSRMTCGGRTSSATSTGTRTSPARRPRFSSRRWRCAPNDVPSLVWLAEMNLAQNRPDAAEQPLEEGAIARPVERSRAVRAWTSGAGETGLRRRREISRKRSHVGPQATRLHYPLALAYRGLGNRSKAEEHLRLRGEVDLPPADPLLGEIAGLLQNAAAYEARGSQALGAAAMARGRRRT